MAKHSFGVAVGFMPQSAEGTYNATLDAITGTWSYTEGLLYGQSGEGIRDSGLTFGLGRGYSDKAFIGSSFTRPLSDWLKTEVPSFEFAFPFCGNRAAASSPPVDADATPLAGLDALLQGAGMTGGAWGSGVGWRYVFGSPNPCSALVYYFGERAELLDCRVAIEIEFPPGGLPVCRATVSVGSVKDLSGDAIPVLTYGNQASVAVPVIKDVGHTWLPSAALRGFSTATLTIDQTFDDFGDSNAVSGSVKEQSEREVVFAATLFSDDAGTNEGFEAVQVAETNQANLEPMQFEYGDAMTATNPVEAVRVVMPEPELRSFDINNIGSKAAVDVELIGRGTSGNDELELIFL